MRESGNEIDWDWEGTTNLYVGMRVNRYTITRVYFLPNSVANYILKLVYVTVYVTEIEPRI